MVSPISPTFDLEHNIYFDSTANYITSGNWFFQGKSIVFSGIASGISAQVVYRDPSTGLLTYGAAPTGTFSPANSYAISNTDPITGDWDFTNHFGVFGIGPVIVSSVDSNVELHAESPGSQILAQADGDVTLLSNAGNIVLFGAEIRLPGLTAAVKSNVVYYDTATNALSYGASGGGGGFDPSADYTTTGIWNNQGHWSFTGQFDIISPVSVNGPIIIQSDAPTFIGRPGTYNNDVNIFSTNNDVSLKSLNGKILLTGSYINGISSGTNGIAFEAVNGGIYLLSDSSTAIVQGTTGSLLLTAGGTAEVRNVGSGDVLLNATGGGNVVLQGSQVLMSSLASVSTADILYYDSVGGVVTYGPASGAGFDIHANYAVDGIWHFNGSNFTVDNANGDVSITSQIGRIDIIAPGATIGNGLYLSGSQINLQSNPSSITIISSTDVTIESSSGNTQLISDNGLIQISGNNAVFTSATDMTLSTTSSFLNISSGSTMALSSVGDMNISSGSALIIAGVLPTNTNSSSVVVVLDPNDNTIKQTLLPPSGSGGVTWVNVTASSQVISANNAYVCNGSVLISFSLPVSAAIGDTFEIVGNSAGGWNITQNAGQQINVANTPSTSGTGGSVSSTNRYDTIQLVCVVANSVFNTRVFQGNLTVS